MLRLLLSTSVRGLLVRLVALPLGIGIYLLVLGGSMTPWGVGLVALAIILALVIGAFMPRRAGARR